VRNRSARRRGAGRDSQAPVEQFSRSSRNEIELDEKGILVLLLTWARLRAELPRQAVRLIVTYPPAAARIDGASSAQALRALGQQVIVESKPARRDRTSTPRGSPPTATLS